MKHLLITLFAVLTLLPNNAYAKKKCVPSMHIFGVAFSLKDSTVYITELQQTDSVWIEERNGFVINRRDYSEQLRSNLREKGSGDMTCVVVMNKDKKKAEKKYLKINKRYNKPKDNFNVIALSKEDFAFKTTDNPSVEELNIKETKAAKKNAKRKNKER